MNSPGAQAKRLRWQLPLGLLGFALVPLAIVMLAGYVQSRRALVKTSRARLGAVAELKASRVSFHLSSQLALAHNLQRRIEPLIPEAPVDAEHAATWLHDLSAIPGIEIAILTLETGRVLASTREIDLGQIWMDPPHVQGGRVETRGVGPHRLPGRVKPVASTIYLPLHDQHGRSRAELVVVGAGSVLERWLASDLPPAASSTLVNFRDHIIARWTGPEFHASPDQISGQRWMQPGGSRIIVTLPFDSVTAPLNSLLRAGGLFFVIMGLVTWMLAVLLGRRLVTREMLFQTRLAHQERMAGVGNLAAGVAHEIGNPLASISAAIQMRMREEKDEKAQATLKMVLEQLDRIHRSVKHLARLTRQPGERRERLLLQDVIERATSLIRYDPRARGVAWDLDLDRAAPSVLADEDAWLQLCLNLLVNALDGMAETEHKKLQVSFVQDAGHLNLVIRDNGSGMSPDTLRRATEPLFTTKPPGKGTGLGLALVNRVAREHGGQVRIRSEEGVYCELSVELPLPDNKKKEPA